MNISEVEYNYIRKQLLLIESICDGKLLSKDEQIKGVKTITKIVLEDLESMKEKPDDS